MKLWFVIYVGAHIGGSVGPLPYDEAECLTRAAEKNAEWQQQLSTGVDLEGNPVTDIARSMHFKCEWHDARPPITYVGAQGE